MSHELVEGLPDPVGVCRADSAAVQMVGGGVEGMGEDLGDSREELWKGPERNKSLSSPLTRSTKCDAVGMVRFHLK